MSRILHILATPRAEGTPNLVLDWLTAGTGHWQAVVSLHATPADLTGRLRSAAAAYDEHALFDLGKWKFPAISRVASDAVRRYRPDVLVCWPTGFANWVCVGARAAGCRKLLVHAGNPAGQDRRNRWMTKYVTWPLAALRATVVCCSDYVRDSYRAASGIQRGLFHTVYNCTRAAEVALRADAARRSRPTGESPLGIMVATLEPHKDHDTLLRAMPRILAKVPDFRLKLAGAGSLRGTLEARAAALGVVGAVEFLGNRTDVPELLGRADLFVFSTTAQEGLGSVLLEALAAGLPVIASDVPACRELLAGGRWGKLVAPADPDALAVAVTEALLTPPSDTAAAREYAAGFTPQRMIAEYLALADHRPAPETTP